MLVETVELFGATLREQHQQVDPKSCDAFTRFRTRSVDLEQPRRLSTRRTPRPASPITDSSPTV
jgi:hypothetical protein